MKKLLYIAIAIGLLSCHPKNNEPVKKKSEAELRSEYLQKALKNDSYKNASRTFQLVRALLDSFKKGRMDSTAVIFVYNNSIATPATQIKTVADVEKGLKKDTAYLKSVQLKVATDMASEDSIRNSEKKH